MLVVNAQEVHHRLPPALPLRTATGILIAGFHTPKGEAQAREQVRSHVATLRFFNLGEGVASQVPESSSCTSHVSCV